MPEKKIKPSNNVELQQACAYRPKEGNMVDNIPCFASLHDKFGFKLLVFLLVFALDAADLISDWLLYHDVSVTEEGLVYGPTDDVLRYSLLAFSIIGSLTFTFEIVNLWWEIFRNDPWIDVDLLSAITVWIEDVPQITLNVLIAACREEAISYFQLVKASVIIVGAVIRIIVSLVRYCNKRSRQDLTCAKVNKDSRRHVIYRAFIMVGLILTLGGAITVFLFTQAERNPEGSLTFKIPHNILEGEYDDQRYFQNVSIYFSHQLFDYDTIPDTLDNTNLIRLLTINEIRQFSADRTLQIQFENSTNPNIMMKVSDKTTTECFQIDRVNKELNIVLSCALTPPIDEIIITFQYTKPSGQKLVFGDIKFNIKVKSGITNTCSDPDFPIRDDIIEHSEDQHVAALHYYRTKPGINNEYHVQHTTTNKGKFYHSTELEDITEVWQTGFAYCKTSGSLAPHKNSDINVPCT